MSRPFRTAGIMEERSVRGGNEGIGGQGLFTAHD